VGYVVPFCVVLDAKIAVLEKLAQAGHPLGPAAKVVDEAALLSVIVFSVVFVLNMPGFRLRELLSIVCI
jgi:hypothetical protein